ncbi:MAG: hypothetical protein KDK00_03030 [Rhodobacteraceae bacterium]|nr:hypothetical protein [Paracoccaceae bacterium]
MSMIADGLLLFAAMTAALYCHLLSRRLKRLGDTDKGLGGVISTLTIQVDQMKAALDGVRADQARRADELQALSARAEAAARHLHLQLASLHDDPPPAAPPAPRPAPPLKLGAAERVKQPGTAQQVSELMALGRKFAVPGVKR